MSSSALSKTSSSQSFSSPAPAERLKTKKQVTLLSDAMSTDTETFGIPTNLDLKLSQNFASSLTAHSDALIDHLNQQIRELKDETGRLYKLVSERELELRRLKQKREEEQLALSVGSGLPGDTAANKIVELSKRVRELTAELESEKTKLKLANKQCIELKMQMNNVKSTNGTATNGANTTPSQDQTSEADTKSLQEKVKQLELKLAEYRNQCQSLRQEIKLAQKVLAQEVGEGVTFQELISGSSGWRGRAQQIIQLQKKVNELRSQVERHGDDDGDKIKDDDVMARKVTARPPANDKHREHIRKVERDNKEHVEKLVAELKALEGDYENMKTKAEASKARNSVLSNELKTVKQQLQVLTKKGEHDDQLIQALLKKQGQLNELVDAGTKRLAEATERYDLLAQQMTVRQQQETTVVDQLKTIIAEKQAQISQLEDSTPHDLASSRVRSSVTEDSDRRVPVANVRLESFHLTDRNDRRESARSQHREVITSAKRPPSSAKNETSGADGQSEIHEMRCLYQVAQVERDKLMELSQTLQKRLTEVTETMVTQQNELSQQRRVNSLLQKQIDRLNIDQTKSGDKVKQAKSADNRGDNLRVSRDFRQADELEKSLLVKSDENEALRAALQSTLQAKEEDMQLFQNIIDEAKSAFLQGLRHFRQMHVSNNAS